MSGPSKASIRKTGAGGLTGTRSERTTSSPTLDEAKEVAAAAVELVKEKLGEELRTER